MQQQGDCSLLAIVGRGPPERARVMGSQGAGELPMVHRRRTGAMVEQSTTSVLLFWIQISSQRAFVKVMRLSYA